MGQLLQELKRRNVFRVGVAYVVVAWLIVQVIETVSEPLGLPDWTEAFFIVMLLAGLPVILLFSWAFELTPEGLKKTSDVDIEESVTTQTGKKLNTAIIVVLALALVYFLWERQGLVEQVEQSTAVPEETDEVTQTSSASIAVLPFVNMSADPEQEYFSDGISEELLNLLAKIPNVRVPARTSSFQFKGQNLDIGEVAKKLNVKHVLEGSVRKADVRVRVTAQLVEAESGYHLWSDTFDRELDDIFAIQDEISAAIVAALSETLGLEASTAPQVNAAANTEAYNAYLLAQHQVKKRTKQDLEAAVLNFERALELDPDYAPAHAGLGLAWYLLRRSGSTYGALSMEESLARALPHINKALQLDGELPEALGIMGLTLDARKRFEEALPYYEKALALNPSLTDVRNWYAQALDDLGRPEEALNETEKAYQADPLSVIALSNYSIHLTKRRRFDRLGPVLDQLAQIDPVRGAIFRSYALIIQGRAAEGVGQWLRAIDIDASNMRVREQAATMLYDLGLREPAISLWPFPDDLYGLVAGAADAEYKLELAQQKYDNEPNNPGALLALAWAQWESGEKQSGRELAGRYLGLLGETRRPLDVTNLIFALDAWERNDEDTMLARLGPLEADIDRQIATGVDIAGIHLIKAVILHMRDEPELALGHLERAAMGSIVSVERLAFIYEVIGWNAMPEFVELQNRHRDYMSQERAKLFAMACGSDGFEAWQPSASECGKAPGPN